MAGGSGRKRKLPPFQGVWPGLARAILGGILLLLPLVLLLGWWVTEPQPAWAWGLPGRAERANRSPTSSGRASDAPRSNLGPQEVAPPAAVQQLTEALSQRQPRIAILEPADGSLLPDGPWTLQLQVEDWPLVDAGSLGLGPHLMVQLDDDLPRPLLDTTAAMPALGPGSHRLTVYAVRPWGEVVKAPGASRQIRLHRVAANPLGLPAAGSPQLLAVSPSDASPGEPVLLDWLLIDAPLQNLRPDDARWRLRVSVNGDSFLVNQQTPLWLKGWKPGSNAVLLELVDGRGEPLNPPFNSLVREVRLDPAVPRPAWLGPRLSPADLATILGEAAPEPPATVVAAPEPSAPTPKQAQLPPAPALPETVGTGPSATEPEAEPQAETPQWEEQGPVAEAPPEALPMPTEDTAPPATEKEQPPATQHQPAADVPPNEPASTETAQNATDIEPGNGGSTSIRVNETAAPPIPAGPPPGGRPPDPTDATLRAARDEVNPDGTLIRPRRPNPLQALRERLGR